jgi:hypothetical protein
MNGGSFRLKHSKRHIRANDRPDHDPPTDAETQKGFARSLLAFPNDAFLLRPN